MQQFEELKQKTNLICFQILSFFLHIIAFKQQYYYYYSYAIFWKDTHFHSYDRVIPIHRLHLILHLNATHLNKEKKGDFLNILPNVSAIPFNCKFLKRIRIMFPSPFVVHKDNLGGLDFILQSFLKYYVRDHSFRTSPFLRGGGVKNWPNLPTDSSKKLPTQGGRGQK